MPPHGAPRRLHRLKLGKYTFMRDFLTQQWAVVSDERHNSATLANASIDVVWDSFQSFLEKNGHPREMCSKILLGKLLREAGVDKIKRGPRRRQKFYYFPLEPVKGSRAEEIMAATHDARYVACENEPRLAGRKEVSSLSSFDLKEGYFSQHFNSVSESRTQKSRRVISEKQNCIQDTDQSETTTPKRCDEKYDLSYNVSEPSLTSKSNGSMRQGKELWNQNDVLEIDDCEQLQTVVPREIPTSCRKPSVSYNDIEDQNRSFSEILVQSMSRLYDPENIDNDGENGLSGNDQKQTNYLSSSNETPTGYNHEREQNAAFFNSDPSFYESKTFVHDGLLSYNTDSSIFPASQTTDVEC